MIKARSSSSSKKINDVGLKKNDQTQRGSKGSSDIINEITATQVVGCSKV
jgi:hypothetical protein